jgi:hypothetical protein
MVKKWHMSCAYLGQSFVELQATKCFNSRLQKDYPKMKWENIAILPELSL